MSGTRYLARVGNRSLFTHLEARAYLAHAAVSPVSVAVQEAVEEVMRDYAKRGAGAIGRWVAQRDRLRSKLATLLGAEGADIGLVRGTTAGVRAIALGLRWERGDRILTFDGEFPANVVPWQRAAELFGLELGLLPVKPFARDHAEGLAALEQELGRGARLVATSAVQFSSGLRMPIAEMAALCHAHGAELFVDAIQAAGVVPLSLRASGVDYAAGGAHKWLMGIEGAGWVYAAPDRARRLRPTVAGWLSVEDATAFLVRGPGRLSYDAPVRQDIRFVEGSSASVTAFAALEASLDLLLQIDVPDIHAHVSAYCDALEEPLLELGFHSVRSPAEEARSGILSVVPPHDVFVVALHGALAARGVVCSIPDGLLRFAPHWPSSLDEPSRVVRAVSESLSAL